MKIVIAEKPSVAKAIAKYFNATKLGDGCIEGPGVAVTWCFGHLFEQAEPEAYGEQYKKWGFDSLPIIPQAWKLEPKSEASKQIKIIGALLKSATEVVHAGDRTGKASCWSMRFWNTSSTPARSSVYGSPLSTTIRSRKPSRR